MMNVTPEQVSDAITELLNGHDLFPYDLEPDEVNTGLCEEFAFAVCSLLNNPANLSTGCGGEDESDLWGHVWLELQHNGHIIYFDSEVPNGVLTPHELPIFLEDRV